MQKEIQDTHSDRLAVGICLPLINQVLEWLMQRPFPIQCMLETDNYFIILSSNTDSIWAPPPLSNNHPWYTFEQIDKGKAVDTSITIQMLFTHDIDQQKFSILYQIENYIKIRQISCEDRLKL